MLVEVVKGFRVDGRNQAVGSVIDLAPWLAWEMIGANNAIAAKPDQAPKPKRRRRVTKNSDAETE